MTARHGMLNRAWPVILLVATGVSLGLISPGVHYDMLVIAAPLLAAALYDVRTTAVTGVLTVVVFVVLRLPLEEDGNITWVFKLVLVVVVCVLSVLLSHVRLREEELRRVRGTALLLQRSLLPRHFPDNSAVGVEHRYVPAESAAGLGGDWFDVIPLSGARVALVMGDVVGHGPEAAATMGRLRTAVHTLADLDLDPDEVLAGVDDLVQRMSHDREQAELVASCLYLVYDPVSRRCDLTSAGHAPPIIVLPGGQVSVPELSANPPLGFGDAPFDVTSLDLPEGSLITLYTDGLLGLRHREADEAMRELAAVISPGGGPLQEICDRVLHSLPGTGEDDIALLLARTRVLDPRNVRSWEFAAALEEVPAAREAVTGQLTAWGLDEHGFALEMVVCELVANAVQHASGPVGVRLIRDTSLICEVSDTSHTAPHLVRADPMDEGGRGLYLVAQLMDRWGTRYTRSGKTIWAATYLGS
ncbi:serine/threonine-protein phosphatase [Streptomyces sp. NBC_01476]|uniref:ATP-binding SpoIIE family protein phosphatase n=1 Tax=Streptomyces sp. NBC_01476 TaxID=2903881 RepID=UPI002E37D8BA|nr:ATP-binding SpoIIE family protein phosphatase [Streptomyces sp. NBC_01476]